MLGGRRLRHGSSASATAERVCSCGDDPRAKAADARKLRSCDVAREPTNFTRTALVQVSDDQVFDARRLGHDTRGLASHEDYDN